MASPGVDSARQRGARELASALAARYVPITRWLPVYPRDGARSDVAAALTSWGVMVPVALAYAGLAGVPPQLGLVTAFAALAAYAVFGTSRHLKVTVSSTMAVMSASVVADLAGGDPVAFVALTSALALIVGAILLAAGIARLGFISDFLAKSVITGFIIGLAITIIVGQVPKILGVPSLAGSLPEQLVQLAGEVSSLNPATVVVGIVALALILLLRQLAPRVPGPLIALVLGILAVPALDLDGYGVAVVGDVATGLPIPSIPTVALTDLPYLVLGALGIVFLAVGESVGAGRAYATRYGYEIDADQELVALGSANLASGLFGGFTADASLSQTATAESAGTRSQVSSLITSGLVLATAVFLAPLFRNLPQAVLGAIVIAGVLSLIDVDEMGRYWRWRRTDFLLGIAAMVGVLLTTVLTGMLLAVALSVAFVLYRASRPYTAALGLMPGDRATYADLARHPDARVVPGLLIVRLDAPLYFFNANVARTQISELVEAGNRDLHAVLIDLAATADLDVTSTDMLFGLVRDLRGRSIEVMLAQVKGPVRDRLRRTGLMAEVSEQRVYRTIGSAVTDFRRRHPDMDGRDAAAEPVPGSVPEDEREGH